MLKTEKVSFDFTEFDKKINVKQYRLSEVRDRLVKVAFDIVKFKDQDTDQLWQIQTAEDGEYIVSMYSESDMNVKQASLKSASDWKVTRSKIASELNFYYKNELVAKASPGKLGFKDEDVDMMIAYLPEKLAENEKLAAALLKDYGSGRIGQ